MAAVQASDIVAAVMQPRVVQKTIERALQDEGTQDVAQGHWLFDSWALTTIAAQNCTTISRTA
jgi:hypothetical protein